MSKRQFETDYPGPNIVIVPTVEFSGGSDPNLVLQPPKKSKLEQQPPIPEIYKVDFDAIPVPPQPFPDNVSSVLSANHIKNQVLSATTNEETTSVAPSPETELKREFKSASRQPSWASNYLTSIGLAYKKPIKLNLSSSRNKFDAAPEEMNKTKGAPEEMNKTKGAPEEINKTKDAPEEINKKNEAPEEINKIKNTDEAIPERLESKNFNENTVNSIFNSQEIEPLIPTCNPTKCYGDENLPDTKINSQLYDDNHLEIIHVNDNHSYLNHCANFNNEESHRNATIPFEKFEIFRDFTIHRPAEDKCYLDKVEQFLAKISHNVKHETKFKHEIKARKMPLSPNHRKESSYPEKEDKNETANFNNVKIPKTQSCDISRESSKVISTKHYYSTDSYNKYNSKSVKRYNEHKFYEIKEQPSTSKRNYDASKSKIKDKINLDEYKTKRDSKMESKSSSRSEDYRRRSLYHISKSQINTTNRGRSYSRSSSEFVRSRSSYHVHTNQCTRVHKKRERSTSSSHSENNRDKSPRGSQNKKYKRKCREASNSSSFSESVRDISPPRTRKHKIRRAMSKSSSSSSENCRDRKTRSTPITQKNKKFKSRREVSNSSSSSSEKSPDKSTRTTKKIKKCKPRRQTSNSSSNSEKCRVKTICQTHKNQENKKHKSKRARSNSSSNSEIDQDRFAHNNKKNMIKLKANRNKCDENNCSSTNKSNHNFSDDKNTCKVVKDKISKDKIKKTMTKSSYSSNIKSTKDDKHTELKLTSKIIKNITQSFSTKYNNRNSNDDKNGPNQPTLIKSVVQVKDHTPQKSCNRLNETEDFDLRSKLSRKNLSQYFSKIYNRNIEQSEKRADQRENLVITVANQDENEEKVIKSDCDKIIEISQKKLESPKAKKFKKIKLVINVICEKSQSSDSEGDESETVKKVNKENNDEDGTVKTVIKESHLSNEELSFLDDLNIDEIVDSLSRYKNEPFSLTNSNEVKVVNNSQEIYTYNLISDSEQSDASTVHLEELCEIHDDSNQIDIYEITSEDESCVAEKNNINSQSQRIDGKCNIKDGAETANTLSTVKSEKESVNQDCKISENEIKLVPGQKQRNLILNIEIGKRKSKYIQDKSTEHEIKEEPLEENTECEIISTKGMTGNNDKHMKDIASINDIKQDRVDEVLDKARTTKRSTVIKTIDNKNTTCNFTSPDEMEQLGRITNKFTQDIIPINEIKQESVDSVIDEGTKTHEASDKSTARGQTSANEIKEIGVSNNKYTQDDIPENEIKKEPKDEVLDEEIKITANQNGNPARDLTTTSEIEVGGSKDKLIGCNINQSRIKNEPADEVLIEATHKTQQNKHNFTPASKINEMEERKDKNNPDTITPLNKLKQIIADKAGINKGIKTFESKHKDTELKIKKKISDPIADESIYPKTLDTITKNMQYPIKEITKDHTKENTYKNKNINTIRENKKDLKTKLHESVEMVSESMNLARYENNLLDNCDKSNNDQNIADQPKNSESYKPTILNNAAICLKDTETNTDTLILSKSINTYNDKSIALSIKGPVTASTETAYAESITNVISTTETTNNLHINSDFDTKELSEASKQEVKQPDTEGKNKNTANKVPKNTKDETSQNRNMAADKDGLKSEKQQELEVDEQEPNSNHTKKGNNVSNTETAVKSQQQELKVHGQEPNSNDTKGNNVSKTEIAVKLKEVKQPDTEEKNTANKVSKESKDEISPQRNIAADKDGLKSEKQQELEVDDQQPNSNDTENGNNDLKTETAVKSQQQELKVHGQEPNSNYTKKSNNVSNTDTAGKSHIYSSICLKYAPSSIKTEYCKTSLLSEKEKEEKSEIEKVEKRLMDYLQAKYTVNSVLYKGRFSKILKCEGPKGQNYVLKLLSTVKKGNFQDKLLASIQKDIPKKNINIVSVINGLTVDGRWCFVMDYYPKNLSQALEENGKSFHINNVQYLSRQLVAALTVLKNKSVVHSDIKPGHIMLNSSNDFLKLCGFDCAHFFAKTNKTLPNVGTVNYRAPEIILGHSAGHSIDVWSAALVMYEMATRRKLFPGCYNNDILFKQICTLGYVPSDMLRFSRYELQHFAGTNFKRVNSRKEISFISQQQIYKNNILRGSINTAYHKEWAKCIPRSQKLEELGTLYSFCQLLEAMLIIHPKDRLPIELVCEHPFLFVSS